MFCLNRCVIEFVTQFVFQFLIQSSFLSIDLIVCNFVDHLRHTITTGIMSLPTKLQRISDELAVDLQNLDKKTPNAENNVLLNGFHSVRQQMVGRHPLESLDTTYSQRSDNQNFMLLKSIQGIQAPLRLIHERRAAQRVQRLPVLNSSNLMLDVLTGKDELIGPEDFLNDVSQPELMAPPHMLCERYGL